MYKSITQLESFDKPREKLLAKGAASLKDYELVAILLGSGVKGKDVIKLSREIVKLFKEDFNNLTVQRLTEIHGLGSAKASVIVSAIELSKRYLIEEHRKISSSSDVYDELKEYHNKKQEYFLAIYLDGANRILLTTVITIGILNQSLVHPREVFAPAIEHRCASIIVAHNHPSGQLEPSSADITITKRLKESGRLLGIELLDHLIFTRDGYYSFNEEGLL